MIECAQSSTEASGAERSERDIATAMWSDVECVELNGWL